jgi:branched-chain amino acid transport system ATP-binding protein
LAHRAYTLQTGKVMLEGAGRELLKHPEVTKAYLGGQQ